VPYIFAKEKIMVIVLLMDKHEFIFLTINDNLDMLIIKENYTFFFDGDKPFVCN
jgi:hypothetical protein